MPLGESVDTTAQDPEEESRIQQDLVLSGEGQNVDRTVGFMAARLGLPVPEEYIKQVDPEERHRDLLDVEGAEH